MEHSSPRPTSLGDVSKPWQEYRRHCVCVCVCVCFCCLMFSTKKVFWCEAPILQFQHGEQSCPECSTAFPPEFGKFCNWHGCGDVVSGKNAFI